jgi:hypothetical protein
MFQAAPNLEEPMRAWVCFDDTDDLDAPQGTGKLARWFEEELPEGCSLWGVVRQQLLVHPSVPYTSHNSSACCVLDIPGPEVVPDLVALAGAHVERHMLDGSDPGVCVAVEGDDAVDRLVAFGRLAAVALTDQAAAYEAAAGVHLSGHGGTEDGVIGAAAGVGLTAWGWSGRFIEFSGLRDHPETVTVDALEQAGILAVPVDRNVVFPAPDHVIETQGWLRPLLLGGRPVVPVALAGEGTWRTFGRERVFPE